MINEIIIYLISWTVGIGVVWYFKDRKDGLSPRATLRDPQAWVIGAIIGLFILIFVYATT